MKPLLTDLTEEEKNFMASEAAVFENFIGQCLTPISKMSLGNIRQALKTMLASGAKINYSTVAAFIQNVDNVDLFHSRDSGIVSPKYQSISNNPTFKSLIDFYAVEQKVRLSPKKRKTSGTQAINDSSYEVPVEGLDAKARTFVRMLQMQVDALENEKRNLTKLLEEKSKKQPISLSQSHQKTEDNALPFLEIVSEKSPEEVLTSSVLSKIADLPKLFPEYFQVESRNEKAVLRLVSHSRKQVLFKSDEWAFITNKTNGDNDDE